MRLVLAPLSLLASAGCSLIYNPNDIDRASGDAQIPDMEVIVDANPDALELTRVRPPVIFEGQGVGGSRQSLVVVQGSNLVTGATVEFLQHGNGMPHPSITVDTANVQVDGNHKFIVVPVTLAVDANDVDVRLDVKVSQPSSSGGVTTQMITVGEGAGDPPAITLRGLPAVESGVLAVNTANPPTLYSRINVTGLAFTGTGPVRVRATSSIAISGAIDISAMGKTGGPGGGIGGTGGGMGANGVGGGGRCPGDGGDGGPTAGSVGQPGTLAVAVTGNSCEAPDKPIASLTDNVAGGGGGGGGGLTAGRAGGGGGGAIEITAGGMLTVGAITANGAASPPGGSASGGPGSGGVVLLRSRGTLMAGTLAARGGSATGDNVGKIRVDNPIAGVDVTADPAELRGPMFDSTTPLVVTTATPTLAIVGTPSANIRITVTGTVVTGPAEGQAQTRGPFNSVLNNLGENNFTFGGEGLFRGVNTVCAEVEGAGAADEGRNCVQLAYVLPP